MGVLRLSCAIALVSAGALGYQLLLVRWLAIAHWHPLAVVIISLALLGHGASGSALSVAGSRAVARFEALFPIAALAFATTAMLVLPFAAAIPFNGLELAWNARQLAWLALLFLVLSVPFFCAACCFGLAFARFGAQIPRLYGADLLGAGAGAIVALLLLRWLPVESAVAAMAGCGVLAAALVSSRQRAWWVAVPLLAIAFVPATPPVNEYKPFAKALLVRDARVVATREGAYGRLDVLESPRVPLRHAPGLSLSYPNQPPAQLGVYVDGDTAGVIVDRRAPAALAYLRHGTSALPWALQARGDIIVLGASAGVEVAQALDAGARRVEVVERDRRIVDLVRGPYAHFSAQLYDDPRVRIRIADTRAFLREDRARHDLIVFAQGASFAAGNAGVQAVAEDYGATVEALRDARARLAPGGVVAITGWDKQPPRDALKLFATVAQAWRDAVDPSASIAMIRNWDAWTLIAREGAFTRADIARIRAFADENGFDLVYLPGLRAQDTNRIHVLPRDDSFLGAQALLSPHASRFIADYKFDIAPARDDRPYFANFFRWSTLPELWRLRAQGAAVLLDSGYLLLVAALVQAIPIAAALVLLPLLALPRAPATGARWRAGAYFVALGFGFLFIEIACLARLPLLVGHPLLAFGAGLAGFLAFAGLGSTWAQGWIARCRDPMPRMARSAVLAIAFGLTWHLFAMPIAMSVGAAWPAWIRAGLALATIAPVAFAMGIPFPLGLARLARDAPAFVPWAWGLNGCASVIAAIAALLLALHVGLTATLAIALAVYALGAWAWRQ